MIFGSGENGEFTFLDIVSILSFFIGLENLDVNLTQEDKQDLQKELTDQAERMLNELHSHLEVQDQKLNRIIKELEELKNDNR